jgi:hypothetical protein
MIANLTNFLNFGKEISINNKQLAIISEPLIENQ